MRSRHEATVWLWFQRAHAEEIWESRILQAESDNQDIPESQIKSKLLLSIESNKWVLLEGRIAEGVSAEIEGFGGWLEDNAHA